MAPYRKFGKVSILVDENDYNNIFVIRTELLSKILLLYVFFEKLQIKMSNVLSFSKSWNPQTKPSKPFPNFIKSVTSG